MFSGAREALIRAEHAGARRIVLGPVSAVPVGVVSAAEKTGHDNRFFDLKAVVVTCSP